MAREVVYEETSPGIFTPARTPAQKRAAKREADLAETKRRERNNIIGALLLIAVVTAVGVLPFIRWY